MSDRPSFALDIGTRKVVGLLTIPGNKGLKIIAAEKLEHSTRAMFDGQIHDVVQVASVVRKIVDRLSAKVGFPLTEAAVAAAGRALRTFKGTASRELTGLTELTHEEVFALELEAVQAAQAAMAVALCDQQQQLDYHYVGHSIMGARLDGLTIGNLVGQRGNQAELDVIATFLPRGVVDSLQAVLERTGMEMTALTLEPIAALSVAVPQTMRHLNLVLVDIGAGTSDIAITSKGSVIAYDMVPTAGDEITEALSEAFLLDFPTGERVKRQIGERAEISFSDILGKKHTESSERLKESLLPTVERLAGQIAERILKLNRGVPQAIMLVGGGSLTPELPRLLAAAVGMSEERIAVRGRDAIAGVEGARAVLNGPDSITPIGIAVASREKSTLGFYLVHVNRREIRLFHPARLTVADALLAAGVAIKELQGKVGKGLTVQVNGELRIVRGTFGKPAVILLNDQPATLETPITHRDSILVEPGVSGEPGRATVGDVAPQAAEQLCVTVNGVTRRLSPCITVNGDVASVSRKLADNDQVVVRPVSTVADVLASLGYEDAEGADRIHCIVDGNSRQITRPRLRIYMNGRISSLDEPVHAGDAIEVTENGPLTPREVAAPLLDAGKVVRLTVNGKALELECTHPQFTRNGMAVQPDEPLADNDTLSVVSGQTLPIFAFLLEAVGIPATPPAGKTRLITLLNGKPAEFVAPLQDGDVAELGWE